MCRICGRVVKCIFDSMPSRVHRVPNRRTFTTVSNISSRPTTARSATSSLGAAFSKLAVSTPATTSTRPTMAPSLLTSAFTDQPSVARTFSTTAPVLGKRRQMDTYSPSRKVQKRRHGFLARLRTKNGQKTLTNRRLRGRKALSW